MKLVQTIYILCKLLHKYQRIDKIVSTQEFLKVRKGKLKVPLCP